MTKRIILLLIYMSDDVEIITNDGSTDNMAIAADDYARNYPGVVTVIHALFGTKCRLV
jgi:hypothetical protein